jgi:hypothetical protein
LSSHTSRTGGLPVEVVNQCVAKTIRSIALEDDVPAIARLHNFVSGLTAAEAGPFFVYDPINDGAIGVSPEDELVMFQGARLSSGAIARYDAAIPLTGPRKGEKIEPYAYAQVTTLRS